MATDEQVQANRENSLLGGVKTDEGKAVSRYNAIKHGLLAKEVLLQGEPEDELEELGKRLRSELRPANELEFILVDRITANTWRLKRALRIERELIDEERNEVDYMRSTPKSLGRIFDNDAINGHDAYGKFARYEASIERGIFRALHELQRLQAARSGEKPLAPVVMDIDLVREE